MRHPLARQCTAALLLAILLRPALSCEEECQTGVTNAFVGNYSTRVFETMKTMDDMITSQLLPKQDKYQRDMHLNFLAPIYSSWSDKAFEAHLEAIFPRFFHGKCQQPVVAKNGSLIRMEDPPGCPNPDCPVVCGTPGSMVHYYHELVSIAYITNRDLLRNLTSSGSKEYKQVEAAVTGRKTLATRQSLRFTSRKELSDSGHADRNSAKKLRSIMDQTMLMFNRQCGGRGSGKNRELNNCSWEEQMKEYILGFP